MLKFASSYGIVQTGRMLCRSRFLLVLLPIAALIACDAKQPAPEGNTAAAEALPDPVTNTTTEAMCGSPEDRAHAISRIAGEPSINSDPDQVYDVAATIAEKGCPKPKG